jgi:hypothetical protein
MIDLYCERLTTGYWAEPVNAATNLAFPMAAWATARLIRRSAPHATALWMLPVLMVAVGVGSALFHTVATTWARVADVLPILLFQLVYLWLYARGVMALGRPTAAAIAGLLLATALLGRLGPAVLNGSLPYAPAALLILGLGIDHRAAGRREPLGLLVTGGLFLVAVGFRSVDQTFCAVLPLGTHFLWHLGAALVLYQLSRALVLNWPASHGPTGSRMIPLFRNAGRAVTLQPAPPAESRGMPGSPPTPSTPPGTGSPDTATPGSAGIPPPRWRG